MVPRDRRPGRLARRAARCLGELSRRILRAAVPLAESDSQVPPVRGLQQGLRLERTESTRSTTRRVIDACAPRSPTATMSRRTSRTSRSSTSTSLANGHSCCATRCATASASPKSTARQRYAKSAVCGAMRCGLRRRRLKRVEDAPLGSGRVKGRAYRWNEVFDSSLRGVI